MTAEEELKRRFGVFGKSSILDGEDESGQTTIWASLSPEDINLIVNLIVERLRDIKFNQ